MNPAALLALISDLYGQLVALREENEALRAQLAAQAAASQPADTQ